MITIRDAILADSTGIGQVTVAASRATFVGVVPAHHLDLSWTTEQSADGWRRTLPDRAPGPFLVAENDGQVVGFVWAEHEADTEGFDASVRGLYVMPAWQRRGVGRRLLEAAVRGLQAGGARSLEIGCVRVNPSCAFYRHFGGTEIGRRPAKVDTFETEEILFGWTDIDALADRL